MDGDQQQDASGENAYGYPELYVAENRSKHVIVPRDDSGKAGYGGALEWVHATSEV